MQTFQNSIIKISKPDVKILLTENLKYDFYTNKLNINELAIFSFIKNCKETRKTNLRFTTLAQKTHTCFQRICKI